MATPIFYDTAFAANDFAAFVAQIKAQARALGIGAPILDAAFDGVTLNQKVLAADQHQPEFTLTFAQYRSRVVSAQRLAICRENIARNRNLLEAVDQRIPADPRIVAGIWGIESGFGQKTGNYAIVEALTTLAYHGRRAAYFHHELMNALKILEAGDIAPRAMTGSWAGAMGQPQFMPSSYLTYAVDFDGDGKRDIWHSLPDVFASVSNYMARSGWVAGEPWGQPIQLPAHFNPAHAARTFANAKTKPLGAWSALGVRRFDGTSFSRDDVPGIVLVPDGLGGDAFMIYRNFRAIRRYNPSDYYALGVGLLGFGSA